MRDLSNAEGIGSDVNYLNGDLVDDQTEINEFINQDLVQFFQKLADLASIAFNDLPDNETNDYQTVEALESVVRSFAATPLLKGVVEKATTGEAQSGATDKFLDAALLQLVTATESRKGVQENATVAEAKALSSSSHNIVPATLKEVVGDTITELVPFSGWNMDTSSQFLVNWTRPASTVIVEMSAVINIGTQDFNLGGPDASADGTVSGGVEQHSNTLNRFTLFRKSGGTFDGPAFNNESGYVVVRYKFI
jgi:hypothetical protein